MTDRTSVAGRKVFFKKPNVTSDGRIYSYQEVGGFVVEFTSDHTHAVIEDSWGHVFRVPLADFYFKEW